MRTEVLAIVAIAIGSMLATSASASPEAEKLFRDGRTLLDAGNLAQACDAFARSAKLEPKVGTLLNLADCRERQGLIASAWSVFLEAKALAAATNDRRAAEAEKRAAALEPKLAYATLTVAPDRQVAGMVIKRNGVAVDSASWNAELPIDPGDYVIEASAPHHKPWSVRRSVAAAAHVAIVIDALVADPASVVAVAPTRRGGPTPPLRTAAIGLGLGATSESDFLLGVRVLAGLPLPGGALRGIGSVLYSKFDTRRDYALGLSVDYVWMPMPTLAFAGGLGFGVDRLVSDDASETAGWVTLRASPIIVRLLGGRLEAGLHTQLVRTKDNTVLLGIAAIDVYFL